MPQAVARALCVSIHDVAPATWQDCRQLLRAVRAVGNIPLTLLVVPCFHGRDESLNGYERVLEDLLSQGHELALHGYTHLDGAVPSRGLQQRFARKVFTAGEGEFSALGSVEAARRLELGLTWFRQRNWPVSGFVAPAWLLSAGSWAALRATPLEYTTTLGRFHTLAPVQSLLSPALFYTTRNGIGRRLSPLLVDVLRQLLRNAPLVRLGLHPRDACHPALLRHAQEVIAMLLSSRQALTKMAFARQCMRTPASPEYHEQCL